VRARVRELKRHARLFSSQEHVRALMAGDVWVCIGSSTGALAVGGVRLLPQGLWRRAAEGRGCPTSGLSHPRSPRVVTHPVVPPPNTRRPGAPV
jgi:hypothetical protein